MTDTHSPVASAEAADPAVGPGTPAQSASAIEPLTDGEFAQLEAMLDGMRQRRAATPGWEFCEGFMAALICCRRSILPTEYWPVLLGAPDPWFNALQQQRFGALWARRWQAVQLALDQPVSSLDDAGAYLPALDHTPPAALANPAASFGQRWAQGFMAVVQAWPAEWKGPRNTSAQVWRASAVGLVEALTQADTAPPTQAAFADSEGPPSVSEPRLKAFADALWAVYNMRDLWRTLGPRVSTVRAQPTPGRNDPCNCGSGKKFKKCCGASTQAAG